MLTAAFLPSFPVDIITSVLAFLSFEGTSVQVKENCRLRECFGSCHWKVQTVRGQQSLSVTQVQVPPCLGSIWHPLKSQLMVAVSPAGLLSLCSCHRKKGGSALISAETPLNGVSFSLLAWTTVLGVPLCKAEPGDSPTKPADGELWRVPLPQKKTGVLSHREKGEGPREPRT